MRYTYQHRFSSGSHSATSLATFWCRLTLGDASVRFRRSDANSDRVVGLAAQRPLSWASERGDDVLDVCFSYALEPRARVGAVDAAESLDYTRFN